MRITRHARDRMADRNVSRTAVEEVYSHPEITYDNERGDPCFVREVDGRTIKVVVVRGTDLVKTVIDQTKEKS